MGRRHCQKQSWSQRAPILKKHPDLPPDRLELPLVQESNILPFKENVSTQRFHQSDKMPEKDTLAAAALPQKHQGLALENIQERPRRISWRPIFCVKSRTLRKGSTLIIVGPPEEDVEKHRHEKVADQDGKRTDHHRLRGGLSHADGAVLGMETFPAADEDDDNGENKALDQRHGDILAAVNFWILAKK